MSAEAAAHAVQSDRLPVRCVVQVLFLSSSEHSGGGKLIGHHRRLADSFRDPQQIIRSPAAASLDLTSAATAGGGSARCPSKREVAVAQQHELRCLREDVARLQVQCQALQAQVDRLGSESGRRRRGLFRWGAAFLFGGGPGAGATSRVDDSDSGVDRTPLSAAGKHGRGTSTVSSWRRSHS